MISRFPGTDASWTYRPSACSDRVWNLEGYLRGTTTPAR